MNDLKFFNNSEATVEQMAASYVAFEKVEAETSTAYQEARSKMVLLSQQSLTGCEVAKELRAARVQLEDLEYQLLAAQDAQETLRARMEKKLIADSQARLNSLPALGDTLQADREDKYRAFVVAAAKATALFAMVEGEFSIRSGNGGLIIKLPDISAAKLGHELSGLFVKEYERAISENKGEKSSKAKLRSFQDEKLRLEKLIEFGPEEAVKKMLINAGSINSRDPETEDTKESTMPTCVVDYKAPLPDPNARKIWQGQTAFQI